MKKKYYLFILLLVCLNSFGQSKIDQFLSVKFPSTVAKKDTILANISVQLYNATDNENASYTLQKILIDSIQNDINTLPSNLESLKNYYLDVEKGYLKSMKQQGFDLKHAKEFKIHDYLGLEVTLYDSKSNLKVIESRFILLNEYLYTLTYYNAIHFNETKKKAFFDSMVIDLTKKPQQMLGHSDAYKLGYVFGQIAFYGILISAALFLIFYFKRKK